MLKPLSLLIIVLALSLLPAQAQTPLVAAYSMQTANGKVIDSGPLHYDGTMQNVTVSAEGHPGPSLHFNGPQSQVTIDGPFIQKLAGDITLTAWIKVERFPEHGAAFVIGKGGNQGFQMELGDNHMIFYHGFWGGWYDGNWGGSVPLNAWAHLAFTFKKGDQGRMYVNGMEVSHMNAPYAFWPVGDPLKLGGSNWTGLLDEVHIYAAQLSPAEVKADMQGTLAGVRAPVAADFPQVEYPVHAALVRFDEPLGMSEFLGRSRQTAQRVAGPDAVDWPQLSLHTPHHTNPLWRESAEQDVTVPLPPDNARPLFRQPWDNVVEPVDKWFRVQPWIWGQFWGYTTDLTAQTGGSDYELWAFPVKVEGAGPGDIDTVTLRLAGQTIYSRNETLRSLTLLLPQNPEGRPYEITINGRPPVQFNAGLLPPKPGDPHLVVRPLEAVVPGTGAPIRIYAPTQPATFPNPKEWDADMKSLAAAAPVPPLSTALPGLSWTNRLGLDAPRSPISIFAVNMSAGMSSAFRFASDHLTGFQGTPEEYASHLAGLGFDRVFEKVRDDLLRENAKDYDRWFAAMALHGMQAGVNVEGPVGQAGMLGGPNLAFYSYNLPEWHAPLFRDYQLMAGHFNQYPNFAGIFTGADNAGYVPYWDWAPPIPNRPWGKAFAEWMGGQPLQTPVGPAITPAKDYEVRGTQAQFIDYIHRYDETFRQYGYFARAVQEVDPRLPFTIGSFGSSPGVGGRGGWPWATIPGKPLFDGLPIQTAYDWNETEFTKPMHNVALMDRLRSYYPTKPTWSIIDNFGLFLGREAMQRNYALTLTRGVEGVGTNSIPHTTGREDTPGLNGPNDRQKIVDAETELHAWIHKYGGIYAGTKPQASIGILYVHDQAISRPILADPHDTKVYAGSHEGKTTEALFLCHAAGWPAQIVTPEELQRTMTGPATRTDMDRLKFPKVLLLTGLNEFDNTWNWYAGLEPALRSFVAGGGHILLDDESVCPVPATKTGMHIAAYIPQGVDFAPLLFDRNRENFTRLNAAMQGIPKPPVLSNDPTIWPVVSETRNVQYVTVVNWGYVAGQNASKVVKPQTGHLTWTTQRPIYDVPGVGDPRPWGSRISLDAARTVDLTHNGFHVYAMPVGPITQPSLHVTPGDDGFYHAIVGIGQITMPGIPVSLTLTQGGETVTLYGVSDVLIKLPIRAGDTGQTNVSATELLSGLKCAAIIHSMPGRMQQMDEQSRRMATDRVQFTFRRTIPLEVALTPAQAQDPALHDLVERIVRHFRGQGRTVTVDTIEPGHVVRSLQVQKPIQQYPQWQTVAADLVLLGTPQNNLLLMDQAWGYLLPATIVRPTYRVTHSPFVGEYQALNLLANDSVGLEVAARMVGVE